jgi:hypothetical protein
MHAMTALGLVRILPILTFLGACAGAPSTADSGELPADTGDDSEQTTSLRGDPFADAVLSFTPGESAGFGQADLPGIVLGPPEGAGGTAGSLDVVSLGRSGEIVLSFDDITLVDGDGPDLLVFENPFSNWLEPGFVAVSADGVTWSEWPCDPTDALDLYPGCAGVGYVWANSVNDLDPTNPEVAGGDAFDLADVGLAKASYVRIRDGGEGAYSEPMGGFDLDALAVVNGESR